jgi:predicted nucleic acid-binding protein
VPETISDTGPILHLHEIGRLDTLSTVEPLVFPIGVWEELRHRSLDQATLQQAGLDFTISTAGRDLLARAKTFRLQPADAEVFLLAQEDHFKSLILTDDLALRRLLEERGAIVAGSVGILVRAYAAGNLSREGLEQCIESLLEESSLHLSRAFRSYVRKLVTDLP